MDSEKQDGIQKLLRAEQEANAIVTAARQGGTVFETFRSFFRARGPRRTPGARFDRFLLGLVSRRINLSTHTLFFLFSFGDYRKNGENQTSQRRSGG